MPRPRPGFPPVILHQRLRPCQVPETTDREVLPGLQADAAADGSQLRADVPRVSDRAVGGGVRGGVARSIYPGMHAYLIKPPNRTLHNFKTDRPFPSFTASKSVDLKLVELQILRR